MTVPTWALLACATWTLALLVATVGYHRWSLILTRRAEISSFKAEAEGTGWYARGTRAHANCVENLPVFGAIVLALQMAHATGSLVDTLSIVIVVARILQSLTHVLFVQTNRAVSVRFTFFTVQAICFLWLVAIAVAAAAAH